MRRIGILAITLCLLLQGLLPVMPAMAALSETPAEVSAATDMAKDDPPCHRQQASTEIADEDPVSGCHGVDCSCTSNCTQCASLLGSTAIDFSFDRQAMVVGLPSHEHRAHPAPPFRPPIA